MTGVVQFAGPPRLNELFQAAGFGDGASDWGLVPADAPLNVRVRAHSPSYRVPAPEHGFQLGFDSGSLQAEDALLEMVAGVSSQRISRAAALSVPAVLRARNMICGMPATLPIELRERGTNELDTRRWLGEQPDPDIEPVVTYALTFEDLLFHSVSYWRVTQFGSDNFPIAAQHVDWRSVSQHATLGFPSELINQDLQFSPRDPVFIDGVFVPSREIIRFVSPNPPLLTHAARAIRTALLLDEAANRTAANPTPLGYFEDSEDQTDPLDDDEVVKVLNDWETARRARVWGYISKGLKLTAMTSPTPEQLQLADSRQHAVLEIARATGLDAEDVGVSTTSRTYQNGEERRSAVIDLLLSNYFTPIQQRLSMPDVSPRHLKARFVVSAFRRADIKTRFESYKIAVDGGWMTPDEVRHEEGWAALTAGQRREIAGNGDRDRPRRRGVDTDGDGLDLEAMFHAPPVSNGNGHRRELEAAR